MPIWCTQDLQGDRFRNINSSGTATAAPESDSLVYGIGTDSSGTNAVTSQYHTSGEGWVGVTTYTDTDGNLRVKKEIFCSDVWYCDIWYWNWYSLSNKHNLIYNMT